MLRFCAAYRQQAEEYGTYWLWEVLEGQVEGMVRTPQRHPCTAAVTRPTSFIGLITRANDAGLTQQPGTLSGQGRSACG